jgi:hypothetical protein
MQEANIILNLTMPEVAVKFQMAMPEVTVKFNAVYDSSTQTFILTDENGNDLTGTIEEGGPDNILTGTI